jgi:predicted transcriptional regulator
MELLSRCGLMVRIEGKIPLYRITDKGEEALGHMRRLEEMMRD